LPLPQGSALVVHAEQLIPGAISGRSRVAARRCRPARRRTCRRKR
jgi:hypothetical protein